MQMYSQATVAPAIETKINGPCASHVTYPLRDLIRRRHVHVLGRDDRHALTGCPIKCLSLDWRTYTNLNHPMRIDKLLLDCLEEH